MNFQKEFNLIYYFRRGNKNIMRRTLFLIFVLFGFIGKSQNFEYQVLFEGIGDNREYFNPLAMPQTILGARSAFEVGVEKEGHRIRGGLSYLYEFGSNIDYNPVLPTLYYQFSDEQKEFIFGAFPRCGKIDFPLAMLTDTLLYYRPNIEGIYLNANWNWGNQNAFVDWVSRQTDTKRENFMAGLSGEIFYKNFFLQNYILLFHDAGPAIDIPGDHIKDYFGLAVQAGIRTNAESKLNGYIIAGLLNSEYRERSVTDGFIVGNSFFAEASGRFKNFGIKSVLNSGSGHQFAYGDRFYRAKNYWRTDVIWYFINHEKVKGKFNLSFHVIDWEDLDQQQQLSIVYVFGK